MKDQPADLMFFDINTGEVLQTIKEHAAEITSVVFDASGNRLVSGCIDGNLRIWQFEELKGDEPDSKFNCQLERTIIAHPGGIHCVDVSSDGEQIASCGIDQVASVWDAETGKLVVNLAGHTDSVLGVAISPDGNLVVTGSYDRTSIIWNLEGTKLATWRGHTGAINEVCFTADGEHIVTAADDQTLRRWNVEPASTTATRYFKDTNEVWRADFSPDKKTVAASSENGMLRLVGSQDGKLKKVLHHGKAVIGLKWLSDGRLVAGTKDAIWVWDQLDQPDTLIEPIRKIELPGSSIWDVNASPNEDRIIVASSDSTALVFDSKTFEKLAVLEGHEEALATARFSPDGKLIATGSDDGCIKIWDAESYEYLYSLDEHRHAVWRAVFSPTDSNVMASSANDGKILLWNLELQESLATQFIGHNEAVGGLTFTADGQSLVSASDDGTVRVWDVETGVELFVFHNQQAEVMIHASFSNDGLSLVTSGVGVVDVRHASLEFESPYLRGDSVRDGNVFEGRVLEEGLSAKELEEISLAAKKIISSYPTWIAWQHLGIAQYRLGQHAEAIDSLQEARRLEKALLNSPDTVKPLNEGYLALAFFKSGQIEKAREMKKVFEGLADDWGEDAEIDLLRNKVNAAFGDQNSK